MTIDFKKAIQKIAPINEIELEKAITNYKVFFKSYLLDVKNRSEVLSKLYPICLKFKEKNTNNNFINSYGMIQLEIEAENLLRTHFSTSIFSFYEKIPPPPPVKNKFYDPKEQWLIIKLLGGFLEIAEGVKQQKAHEWNYKTNFLNYINGCLNDFGLHSNILKRNPEKNKRFNLVVYHSYRSRDKLVDFKCFLTLNEFNEQFTKLYCKQKPIKFGGKLVSFKSIHEIKITTTLLQKGEISLFALKNNFTWNDKQKDIRKFIFCCQDETELYHQNPFEELKQNNSIDESLLEKNKDLLLLHPRSYKLFYSAYEKFNNKTYQRNVLDDLRLSLELLLKEKFKNGKSLENQISEIGSFQKQKGGSPEIINMFQKLIDCYSKYQNTYVKHNDNVKSNEIEFVFNLTLLFIRFILT